MISFMTLNVLSLTRHCLKTLSSFLVQLLDQSISIVISCRLPKGLAPVGIVMSTKCDVEDYHCSHLNLHLYIYVSCKHMKETTVSLHASLLYQIILLGPSKTSNLVITDIPCTVLTEIHMGMCE